MEWRGPPPAPAVVALRAGTLWPILGAGHCRGGGWRLIPDAVSFIIKH